MLDGMLISTYKKQNDNEDDSKKKEENDGKTEVVSRACPVVAGSSTSSPLNRLWQEQQVQDQSTWR